jgi:PAS domain S-box-containing protein
MVTLEWLSEHYGTISAVGVIILGILARFRSFFHDTVNVVRMCYDLHRAFGFEAGEKLESICHDLQLSTNTLEIRAEVYEKVADIGIFICSTEGRCLWVNTVLSELYGLDSTEMLGFGWLSAVHPLDRQRVHDEWLYSIKTRISYNCQYTICNNRKRSSKSVMVEAIAVMDDNDNVNCYVGYISELNDRPKDCCYRTEE